jgi:hypothetical protein
MILVFAGGVGWKVLELANAVMSRPLGPGLSIVHGAVS